MKVEILKCHGSNNDFVLIDDLQDTYQFSEEERIHIANRLCNREGLVGGDGILFVEKSDVADARMRMFNPDGSEAEMCGNGLRCVARYASEHFNKTNLVIETKEANLAVEQKEDIFDKIPSFEVAIEPVSFDPDSLPLQTEEGKHIDQKVPPLSNQRTFTGVSVPNPHLIAIVDQVDDQELSTIGKRANENKSLLPNGVNVSFVQPLGTQKVFVRTYERGVGLTNACGTAMSASSLNTVVLGYNQVDEEIFVFNRGGFVICVVHQEEGQYRIKLRGNATYEYKTTILIEGDHLQEVADRQTYDQEATAYEALQNYAAKEIERHQ